MGIDFSHGEAHWSYSGFNRFRCKLIETMGLGDLNEMYDDGSYTKLSSIPIYPLINHSDCKPTVMITTLVVDETLSQA